MKFFYLKKLLLLSFLFVVCKVAFTQLQKSIDLVQISNSGEKSLDSCDQPTNVVVDYEEGMPTALVNWDGEQPQEGWILLYGPEGTIDIGWFLSDPENYENPEANMERVHSSPHYLYMNMLHQAPYEIYVISDCGDGLLIASDMAMFVVGERGEEIIGEDCETPFNVSGVQNDSHSIDLSWEPNDGGLYQIAWGPFGLEMNEGFFDDPQTGSVIVSDNPYHLEFPRPGAEEPHGVFIRKFCGDNLFSDWQVPSCMPPIQLDSHMSETEVLLTWTPTGQEMAWQIAYGPQGINPNEEGDPNVHIDNIYNTPSHTLLFTELEQGIDYDFYVRTNCSGNNYSEWAGPGFFSTDFGPCNSVEELYANHVTHQSADILWTPQSGEYHWDVTYGLAPLDPDLATTITVDNPKAILMGLQSSSTYEVFITSKCVSGETAQSENISFTTTESDDIYCIPYFLNGCTYDFIDHLILDGENNTRLYDLNTGCTDSNFNDRTDEIVDLAPGNVYFTRVSHGNFPISGDNLAIWIDFNDDGIFDNETERVGDGALAAAGFTNVNFSIPENANPGQHRMRIMLAFNAYPYQLTPCNDGESISTNGEVHDYMANILSLQNCNNTEAGTTISDFAVCMGEDFTISVTGSSDPATGLERKWQSSPADQNNWSDVSGGLLSTATVYGGIQQPTDFRYVVTCTLSGENSISNILQVSMSNDCYCKPESNCGGPGGLQINNVTLVGETITLNNQTGCSGNGYGDYTIKFAPDLKQGVSYSLFVTANNASLNDDKIKAWIDFNNNKIFEPEEVIMNYPAGLPDYTVTDEFTVPVNVNPGLYRMRVRIGWWGSPTLEGCSILGFGETEDYLIEVIPGEVSEDCPQPFDINVVQESDPTVVSVSWSPGGAESEWEVVHILAGNDPNEGEPLIIQENPTVLIDELEPDTDYEVYVRALCGENNISEWAGPIVFRTGSLFINDTSFEGFRYFPVPATDKLNLKSVVPIEEVTILDLSGKKLMGNTPSAKNSDLDISGLSPGVYFMKVRLNSKSKIYKIIKK